MYAEKKYNALLKCKVVLLPTAEEHGTIYAQGLILVFLRDLPMTPWSLGTSPHLRLCVLATRLCRGTESGSLATESIKKK